MLAAIVFLFLGYALLSFVIRRLKLDKFEDRYVFVTGCDTGFGQNLARRLDKLGFRTFAACLTANAVESLDKVTSSRLVALQCDVTNDDDIAKTVATVKSHLPTGKGIWAIVNNAGITGDIGLIEWFDRGDWKIPMNVNLLGMISITNHFLPLLRKSGGRVINTASVLGRIAVGTAPYVVSKYCVEGYSDVLRRELLVQGVSVHIIEPGAFRTTITDAKVLTHSVEKTFKKLDPSLQQFYGESYCSNMRSVIDLVADWAADSKLDKVVDAYVHAITARFPKTRYLVGVDANILFRLLWNLPDSVADFLLAQAFPAPQGHRK